MKAGRNEGVHDGGPGPVGREIRLNQAFVALADTLTSDYDLVELLQLLVDTCTELLDTSAGGLMLADARGRLQVMVSTSEDADLVELVQVGAQDGPCFQCFTSGLPVTVADISAEAHRWPAFAEVAAQRGFASVHATPMRLRQEVIGTMNLLGTRPGALRGADIAVAQALTDVATIGILQERVLRESHVVSQQLQSALGSRVVIEQAKGVLAAVGDLTVDEAFRIMRDHARRTNTPLRTIASGVVDRSLDVLGRGRSPRA